MSNNIPPIPPITRFKATTMGNKKPQKDPTGTDTTSALSTDIRTKEQAVEFLTSKDYLTTGNPINLQIIAHALSQLGVAANKMPKALTDGISAIVVLINDYATQQIANEIVETVKTQLQEHLDAFTSNVETMRDAVEHVTGATKEITGRLNELNDGFQDSAEQLVQATHELTERTAEKTAEIKNKSNTTDKELNFDHYLKTYASAAKQQIPPTHEAVIARGEQSAKQILIKKDPKIADNVLSSLSEKELVTKANTTLNLMDTESLEMPPGTAFVGAKKLRNGNVLYQLNTNDAGNWIKQSEVQKAFMDSYGGTSNMQNKLHYAIAEFVPVTFIENSSFMHSRIEEESGLRGDTLAFSKYIKPAHLRNANQKVAHVTLGFIDRHAANTAIQTGLFIEGKHVNIRKKLIEPRRCLKCQKFGHYVPDCKADKDICARCSGQHRTSECKVTSTTEFSCSNCLGENRKGHGAADRNCPAFKTESDRLLNRTPDNRYKYFPTSAPGTWTLLNEPDIANAQHQQSPANAIRQNSERPDNQQQPNEWQSTRRGIPNHGNNLTYQDRHYVPNPKMDTYKPDNGWTNKNTQSTLDSYVKHPGANTQASQRNDNAPPPATQASASNNPPQNQNQRQTSHTARSQSIETLEYA
jgi:hypothetical protein